MIIHLRDELLSAPRRVAEHCDPVNQSLGRSPYDRGRYLEILVKTRRTGEVDEFLSDLKRIVEGDWADEDLAGAERRFEVLAGLVGVSNPATTPIARGARACWTPASTWPSSRRRRTRPVASSRCTTSSAGLSGGQRQKLVIFCLGGRAAIPAGGPGGSGAVVRHGRAGRGLRQGGRPVHPDGDGHLPRVRVPHDPGHPAEAAADPGAVHRRRDERLESDAGQSLLTGVVIEREEA